MSPRDFQRARKEAKDSSETEYSTLIYNHPYFPNLLVDTSTSDSIITTAITLLFSNPSSSLNGDSSVKESNYVSTQDVDLSKFEVTEVEGGITNALFCISGFTSYNKPYSSILLRIFGAEGMIDRDIETSTFATLAQQELAPPYYGRFGNGRIEGYYEGAIPLSMNDLRDLDISKEIAVKLANMHYEFCIPPSLGEYHDEKEPSLWGQLGSWIDQAMNIQQYQTKEDDARAKEYYNLQRIQQELKWLKADGIPAEAQGIVAFCHNDLLAANILKRTNGDISLIDFEYGGVNYIAFDIANHFNEFCGGTSAEDNGVPDYTRFPSEEQQDLFLRTYLDVKRQYSSNGDDIVDAEEETILLLKEVKAYVLVNHLYWGLWAVNQAATEGTSEFDYLEYSKNRFKRYFEEKLHIHSGK